MGINSSMLPAVLEVEGRVWIACGGGGCSNAGHRLVAPRLVGLDLEGCWL